jgi:diguanylate cyclase (GGDEF)-like protein
MLLPSQRRARLYGLVGALLALGAPLGWLALQLLTGKLQGSAEHELSVHLWLYAYLTLGTMVAFTLFGVVVGAITDKLLAANRRLEELVVTDSLTSLRNRRYFRDRLVSECARAGRGEGPLALVVIDLDHFKQLNDALGHSLGDLALTRAAQHLATSCRISDVACRIGGEEFALICPDTSLANAVDVAERIRLGMRAASRLTASFGVSVWRPSQSADELFKAADTALYEAKEAGRNRVCPTPKPGHSVGLAAGG